MYYHEAQGQPLSVHIDWMRSRGWDKASVILPHDGAQGEKVFATSYESAIREAGFDVLVVPNQGAGAAKALIETVLSCCRFDGHPVKLIRPCARTQQG